jgi:hydrogenase expression/formation protein HypE
VLPLAQALVGRPGLRFMRDPTRGGLATVAHEIARATGHGVRLREADIPVRPSVEAVCDMLGYDPLYLACEGRVVAALAPEAAAAALADWRALPGGEAAAVIGRIEAASPMAGPSHVVLQTRLGGERLLNELEDDPLPRIC